MKQLVAVLAFAVFFSVVPQEARGQDKPRVGILPFSGGSGRDGERISAFFIADEDIREAFAVVRPSVEAATLMVDLNFLSVGYTDSDVIARLGTLLNVDFIISGHILHPVNRTLIAATIINVETHELLYGDWRDYDSVDDYRDWLPEISRNMIEAAKRDTSGLPKLALAPFHILDQEAAMHDAEVMFQILSLEITNTGKFAVLPRVSLQNEILDELEFMLPGVSAEEEAEAIGRVLEADYVLMAEVSVARAANRLYARVFNTEERAFRSGESRDYNAAAEGIELMPDLALSLSSHVDEPPLPAGGRDPNRMPLFAGNTKFWSVGMSTGVLFSNHRIVSLTTVSGTVAPFFHSFFEFGADFNLAIDVEKVGFYVFPYAHFAFFLPLHDFLGFYLGAGGGFLFSEQDVLKEAVAVDIIAGFEFLDMYSFSYTLRTALGIGDEGFAHKVSLGFFKRF